MGLIIIGVVLVALGGVLAFVVRTRIKNKNIEIQFMKTTTISELMGTLKENEAQGLENYREYAELKGIVSSDNPQKAPTARLPPTPQHTRSSPRTSRDPRRSPAWHPAGSPCLSAGQRCHPTGLSAPLKQKVCTPPCGHSETQESILTARCASL